MDKKLFIFHVIAVRKGDLTTDDHYIISSSYDKAKEHIMNNYKEAGWDITSMVSKQRVFFDIDAEE